MKNIIIFLVLIVIATAAAAFFLITDMGDGDEPDETVAKVALAQSVEDLLAKKEVLIEELVKSQVIVQAVKDSNAANSGLSEKEILELDEKWRAIDGIDEYINQYINNDAARELLRFQQENPDFPEIFITDKFGLNVAQTNKTTDFYQADEDWWIGAYDDGKGKISRGSIEFDDSSQSESISVYIPIREPETKEVIGITKAVIDVLNLKLSL